MTAAQDLPVPETLADITAAHQRLLTAARTMTSEAAQTAIDLPGWTRGHILVHLGDLSRAFARQATYAAQGRTVEVYEGGRPARDKSIDSNHDRPIEWLRTHLKDGLSTLEEAWARLSPADWQHPTRYRDLPLIATQWAWWREVELHSVDAAIGYRAEDWSTPLSAHVIDFLQPRLPPDRPIELRSTDSAHHWAHGARTDLATAEPVQPAEPTEPAEPRADTELPVITISGPLRSIAAWISGRPAAQSPSADGSTGLPELGAWP